MVDERDASENDPDIDAEGLPDLVIDEGGKITADFADVEPNIDPTDVTVPEQYTREVIASKLRESKYSVRRETDLEDAPYVEPVTHHDDMTRQSDDGDTDQMSLYGRVVRSYWPDPDDEWDTSIKVFLADCTGTTVVELDERNDPPEFDAGDEIIIAHVEATRDRDAPYVTTQSSVIKVVAESSAPAGYYLEEQSPLVGAADWYEQYSAGEAREMTVNTIVNEYTIVDVTGTDLTWMYDHETGTWVKHAGEELDHILAKHLPASVNRDRERSNIIKNVNALCRDRENPITIGTPDDPDNRYRIGVENGVIDVRKPVEGGECLLNDAPEHKLTDKLPVTFDPDADCPKIDEVIRQICGHDDDKVKVVYEMFGHVLMRNYDRRQAVIKLGPEESGKSFLDTILGWLVGDDNIEAATLEKLMKGSFETAALKQSLAVVDDDSTNKKLSDAQWLKKAVGSGLLRVDEKNINRETIDNSATIILNANNPPVFGGTKEGVRSRVLPIVFNQKFTENPDPGNPNEHKKRDESELRKELKTDEELSGMLNKAIKGAQRLIEDGWSDGRTAEERWQLYNEWADDVESALVKCFTEKAGAVMKKQDAYAVYVAYCHENGLEPTGKSQFWKLARKSDIHFETGQRNDGTRTVKHVMLTPRAMELAPGPVREKYKDDVEGGELSHPLDDVTELADVKRWNEFATVEARVVAREVYPNGVVEITLRDESGATTLRAKPQPDTDVETVVGSNEEPPAKLDGVQVGDTMRAECVSVVSSGLSVVAATSIELTNRGNRSQDEDDAGNVVNSDAGTDTETDGDANADAGSQESQQAARTDGGGTATEEPGTDQDAPTGKLKSIIDYQASLSEVDHISTSKIKGEMSARGHSPGDVDDAIDALKRDGVIKEPSPGTIRPIAKTGETDELDEDTSVVSQVDRLDDMMTIVREIEDKNEDGAPVDDVLNAAEDDGLDREKAEREIEKLKHKGEVYEPAEDRLRTT